MVVGLLVVGSARGRLYTVTAVLIFQRNAIRSMNRWQWAGGLRRALITPVRVSRSPLRGQEGRKAAGGAAVQADLVWNICDPMVTRWQRSIVARRVFTVKFTRGCSQLICHRISVAANPVHAALICSSSLFSPLLLSFFLCFIAPRPPPAATETQFPTLLRFVSPTPSWTTLFTYRYHLVLRSIRTGVLARLSGAPTRTRIHPRLCLWVPLGHSSARS